MNIAFCFAVLAPLARAYMLRAKGITEIAIPASTSPAPGAGFVVSTIPPVVGSTPPVALTTPAPYETYSALFDKQFQIAWTPTPNAFNFDVSNIAKLDVDQMGSNFRVIKTASPVYLGLGR